MNVVVAIDSFKGSLSSQDLAKSINKGILNVYHDAVVSKLPIADGGEGTVKSLVSATNGEIIEVDVHDPLMRIVKSFYGILGDGKTAVIEMALASGLPMLKEEERNPNKTTTFGVGELIKDAISKGCREFIIGLGGSATNDAGLGMMQALGMKFYNHENIELGFGGEILNQVARIDNSKVLKELNECRFTLACDVDNPLYGKNGAAYIYAKQKGADDQMIASLDLGLQNIAKIIQNTFNKDIANLRGAGAAGGLGGGFMAFLDSKLKSGIDLVLEKIELEKYLKTADFVITGEGKIDAQSVMGKAPTGVAKLAKKYDIPVIAIAGCVADDAVAVHDYGIDSIFSIINYPISLVNSMKAENTQKFVIKNIEEIFRLIKVCEKKFN